MLRFANTKPYFEVFVTQSDGMIRRLKFNVIFAQALYRYQEETGQLPAIKELERKKRIAPSINKPYDDSKCNEPLLVTLLKQSKMRAC